MRKYFLTIALITALLLGGVLTFIGCEQAAPGAEPSSLVPTANNTYDVGKATRQWAKAYVVEYYRGSSNITFPASLILVGTTDTQTLTNKTLTSPTVNGGTVASSTITTPTITSPTITGTVSGNATFTSPTISGTLTTIDSPTITGTMVNANVAMGTANITSGTTEIVTHGLSGTPTIILLTWMSTPDNSDNATMFCTSVNGTDFTANSAITQTDTPFSWVAWLLGE